MFGSLKSKFSPKNSTRRASSVAQQDPKLLPGISGNTNNPFASPAPATRRPCELSSNNDAPPAYTVVPSQGYISTTYAVSEQPNGSSNKTSKNIAAARSAKKFADNDPYAFLSEFDTVFLIDDSESMAWDGCWNEAKKAIAAIAPICTLYDDDGIDIWFMNTLGKNENKAYAEKLVTAKQVEAAFKQVSPNRSTPTSKRLDDIIQPYLERLKKEGKSVKPLNIIVITDGQPSHGYEPDEVIIETAQRLRKYEARPWQLGIQFIQVGNNKAASEELRRLDDELKAHDGGKIRDIVDTTPFRGECGGKLTGDGILKAVLGGVNKRQDRKTSRDLHV
ncbi:hypothetical protein M501DRAFT_924766 [Patellaria atrata CBS 101060]|uniref:VWFA domain-containing protein n=1 Tax=Patellaria atrata CBS 101060 TaxID=1346257 RepID=A0A9P4SJI9_9PEZI|nr:hypothetical protein M501DRAFT_924766 [Patellaria atrata CBS 101060]